MAIEIEPRQGLPVFLLAQPTGTKGAVVPSAQLGEL